MALSGSDIATRLTESYKGIEGFYILNGSGNLGYFSAEGGRLFRETFDETNSDQPAIPPEKIELFFAELRAASESFPPGPDKELGYVTPVDDNTLWNTATLVLHEQVAKDLKDAFDRDLVKGLMTLDEGDRRIGDITQERGLHRGFEDLVNHVGAFGTQTLFPVLYFLSAADLKAADDRQPLRVLNLLSLITGTGRFTDIIARMRQNLAERGALNKESRLEHKFTLQE